MIDVSAEHKGKQVMHDPFSMRPFFGYNFGDYLQHWLDMGTQLKKPPQFFMVNWFRKGQNGGLLWPGFGDNIRVIQWILGEIFFFYNLISFILTGEGRCDGVIPASGRPIGWVPTREEVELLDIEDCEDIHELLSTPTSFWREEVESMRTYFTQQVSESLPEEMWNQLSQLERRVSLFDDDDAEE